MRIYWNYPLLFFALGLIFACKNPKEHEYQRKPIFDSVAYFSQKDTSELITIGDSIKLTVNDTSKYGKKFIKCLLTEAYSYSYLLVDSALIIGKEVFILPTHLPLNKQVIYKFEDLKEKYVLKLTRLNYTDIKYTYTETNDQEIIDEDNGIAELGCMFFLGSEMDEDEEGGYDSTEYWNHTTDCSFSIRIEETRAKIKRHCKNSKKNIELEGLPILKRQK